ncbi:MAG: hypothetical protein AAGH15_06255 [Myxococcota bacterium]
MSGTSSSARVSPCRILDGQAAMAFGSEVAVLVFRVPKWTVELADRLYEESTALTGRANPRTIVHMLEAEPGARVRRRLADLQSALDRERPATGQRRVAVLADSPITRGAVTALGWLSRDPLRGFPSREAMDAARWVAHAPKDAEAIHALYVGTHQLVGES